MKGANRAPRYRTIDDMGDIPLPDLLNRHAVVVMWVIDSMIPQAIELGARWGLKYATVGFYWTKYRPSGKEHIGLGYYTRANPEQAWIWTRGNGLPVRNFSVRRWLHAPVGGHSVKPQESYARLETLFGDVSRADVFARIVRPGWDAYGDEIDGRDITEAIVARTARKDG
jgi:N6-adenosine-specific RNA methylase IME4